MFKAYLLVFAFYHAPHLAAFFHVFQPIAEAPVMPVKFWNLIFLLTYTVIPLAAVGETWRKLYLVTAFSTVAGSVVEALHVFTWTVSHPYLYLALSALDLAAAASSVALYACKAVTFKVKKLNS